MPEHYNGREVSSNSTGSGFFQSSRRDFWSRIGPVYLKGIWLIKLGVHHTRGIMFVSQSDSGSQCIGSGSEDVIGSSAARNDTNWLDV
jgi:hypothetical protein